MDDTVLKLLEELEQVVDEGRSSPFSNKVFATVEPNLPSPITANC